MSWQVFYTPHTDDESIGMAGAIARAREAGDNVLVVLVTDNRPSSYMTRVFGYEDRVDELATLRRVEWVRAMKTLDVTELRYWDLPEHTVTTKPFDIQNQIELYMLRVHFELSVSHHHTVWGLFDLHIEGLIGSLSHGICANAMSRMAMRTNARASLYGVYVYSMERAMRFAPHVCRLTPYEHEQKQRALSCYRASEDTLGYGYRSVPELIDHAAEDPHEYRIEIGI